jgi:lysophospholipase L1-like esterase
MPRSILDKQKRNLRRRKSTHRPREFAQMRSWFAERVNIVAEGDSWFAYPPQWLMGKPPHLIAHISGWTRGKANFLAMASNGDEAVDMLSGREKHALVELLRWHTRARDRKPVDLLLFSGGGNDVVGENDFERFIRPFQPGFTARQCLRIGRLERKIRQIGLAYQELADIRDHYSPSTVIMTHTYDYPFASLDGANFLGGLVKTRGWMKRFMDEARIPAALQTGVIRALMGMMAEETLKIGKARTGFIVVDTRGTLLDRRDWLNEIHPNRAGFRAIADRIYVEIEARFPALART